MSRDFRDQFAEPRQIMEKDDKHAGYWWDRNEPQFHPRHDTQRSLRSDQELIEIEHLPIAIPYIPQVISSGIFRPTWPRGRECLIILFDHVVHAFVDIAFKIALRHFLGEVSF